MFNAIQVFGLVLLGGLAAGELSRRVFDLPRTTGYVLLGLAIGESGFRLVTPEHIASAELFIDLALGLILFELGYLVPRVGRQTAWRRLVVGIAIAAVAGAAIMLVVGLWGFSHNAAFFAGALCLATSPAITIATSSDVGAKGPQTGLLYTIVAVTGSVAFSAIALAMPSLGAGGASLSIDVFSILSALALGIICAAIVLLSAVILRRQPEHRHLLILGVVVAGVGTAVQMEVSVFLPMLICGVLVRQIDRERNVVAIRIASDARVFLVITFVLAGAALDIRFLQTYWMEALILVTVRFAAQALVCTCFGNYLDLSQRDSMALAVGLQPMSSVALVLLANARVLETAVSPELSGILMATVLLMQVLGPLATQTAIKTFGEASGLRTHSHKPAQDTA
jgi:Kef-type K+ transport system membrane component KefB